MREVKELKENKRDKLTTFILTLLIFGSSAFLMPIVQAQVTPPVTPVPQIPLEGDVNFKVHPDGSIEVKVVGSLEHVLEAYEQPPPVYKVVFDLVSSPAGMNVTNITGGFVIKLSPEFSLLLSALDLDIEVHSEGTMVNATILFNLPHYLGVNGTIRVLTDEATWESTLDFDLTATIWYEVTPKENIQEFVQMFPMFKSELASQMSEQTEGNLTLQDLTLVRSEIGVSSATLTFSGSIVGNFVKGLMAPSTKMVPPNIVVPQTVPTITPEELIITRAKSADLHVTFNKKELIFEIFFESVIEGDVDKQVNLLKGLFLEGSLQAPSTTQEMALFINNFLLPTDISIVNLNINSELTFDGEKVGLYFAVEGLGFKPPSVEAFLTILQKTLTGASMPSIFLTLEGGSDEKEFVEIEVPPTTSEPVSRDPRKVVWAVDNLSNIYLIVFNVREWPTLTSTVSQTEVVIGDTIEIEGVLAIEGEPVEGQEVDIVVNEMVVETVETDADGGFSSTYKFDETGSYEVKSNSEYYEKTLESPITTVAVKPSSLQLVSVVPVIGIGVAVVVVSYILVKRR